MSLHTFLTEAANSYYQGINLIDDETFDKLAELCNYKEVGHRVVEGVQIPYRMYSLNKFYEGESESSLNPSSLVQTPKLDGAAIALIYISGKLEVILTRGDGITGKDISHLIPAMPVPLEVATSEKIVQITGEIVAPSSIPNARNYASGALGLKDVNEFKTRTINFAAYGVRPYIKSTFSQDMRVLADWGFQVVTEGDWSAFPQDGKVFRVDCNETFESLGFTAHHPKGAYALKTRKEGVITTLNDVVWQVGKSGVVSPVAILEPVMIDGATIGRATLHNMKYIKALELEIGCSVEVVRSGGVVPRIVRRI